MKADTFRSAVMGIADGEQFGGPVLTWVERP
jgi:hypothetical protein